MKWKKETPRTPKKAAIVVISPSSSSSSRSSSSRKNTSSRMRRKSIHTVQLCYISFAATNLQPLRQLGFLIRAEIVKYAKPESHLYIIESYKTFLLRHCGGRRRQPSPLLLYVYTYSIHTNTHTHIYFSSMFPVFLFLFTSALFLKRPLYTHARLLLYSLALSFTIHDSRQLLARIWISKDRYIYISCRCVYLILDFFFFLKKEKISF